MIKNVTQRKNLVFFTSSFPYGSGETFIESELPFIAGAFEKVFILMPAVAVDQLPRPVPKNTFKISIEEGWGWGLRIQALYCNTFWLGFLLDMKRKNRQTDLLKIFRYEWHYFKQALGVKKAIKKVIEFYNLKPQETILYSYWLDEKALGIALFKVKFPEIKVLSRAHGWDVFEERHNPPFLPFRIWLFKTLDIIAVVSKKGFSYLSERFEPQEGKVVVSYLGTEKFGVKQKTKNEKYSIVSCSSLIPLKRVELIMEALSFLNFPVNWTHIGDGPLREELEKKASSFFDGKNIEYCFTGQLTKQKVREFYETRHVDLFISTSETEGLPVSMMEAQSGGIPILATDVGGVNEILINRVTGWLLPANPEPALVAEKIMEIYELKNAEKQKIGKNALSHWQKNFNAENNYTAFVKLLQNL